MKRAGRIALGLFALAAIAAAGAAAFVYFGVYNVAAVEQHTRPVYWLMEFTMLRSVAVRARDDEVPDLKDPQKIARGLEVYRTHCEQCHGGPGVAPQAAALGLTPVPAYLVPTAREWSAAKLHWVVKNGIKMTGMPAWKYRLSEDEMWQVVAFMKERLPYVTAEEYRAMSGQRTGDAVRETRLLAPNAPGDPDAGRRAMDQYACATCHVIPGVAGAVKQVGPPLTGMAARSFIGGVLANTPENMVRWLMSPPAVTPATAMPDLHVREQDARDMAAYLATLTAD